MSEARLWVRARAVVDGDSFARDVAAIIRVSDEIRVVLGTHDHWSTAAPTIRIRPLTSGWSIHVRGPHDDVARVVAHIGGESDAWHVSAEGGISEDAASDHLRDAVADAALQYPIDRLIGFTLTSSLTLKHNLSRLLEQQRGTGRDRALAQHLVGAKLELRYPREQFPGVAINRDPVDAADTSAQKPGDFELGDTVFHVTVAPNKGHFEKCEENLRRNLRPTLLVPERVFSDVVGTLRLQAVGRIDVFSVESFIAQNIEELAVFSQLANARESQRPDPPL